MSHGPGREARVDYKYERTGVVNLFMLIAPLGGWREVFVRDRRTAFDYAHVLRELADLHFPSADKITLVHSFSSIDVNQLFLWNYSCLDEEKMRQE